MNCKFAVSALFAMMLLSLPACREKQPGSKQYFVAFSQCNNAEPYRAA